MKILFRDRTIPTYCCTRPHLSFHPLQITISHLAPLVQLSNPSLLTTILVILKHFVQVPSVTNAKPTFFSLSLLQIASYKFKSFNNKPISAYVRVIRALHLLHWLNWSIYVLHKISMSLFELSEISTLFAKLSKLSRQPIKLSGLHLIINNTVSSSTFSVRLVVSSLLNT